MAETWQKGWVAGPAGPCLGSHLLLPSANPPGARKPLEKMPIQIFCSVSLSSGEEASGPLGDVWGPHHQEQRDNSESEEEEKEKEAMRKEARQGDSPTDLVAFANSCTLHGASHVFVEGGPGPRQALWAVAFVLALGAFLCQVGDRVAYYLSYPHATLLDEVATTELAFPAVTLCNTNAVRLSQLSYPDLLYLAPMLGLDESDDPGVPLAPPGPEAFSGEPFNLHRFYNRSCHRLEDMLLYCSYCGGPCGPHNFSVVSGGPCLAHPKGVCHGSPDCPLPTSSVETKLPRELARLHPGS